MTVRAYSVYRVGLGNSEGGSAPLPNLPPGRSASRRTATGWAPCVRGDQSTGCAGGAGARSGTSTERGVSRGHVAPIPTPSC